MKIGDKVRFLSEVGGGRVAGFQGKNIVLVEDEDGFQVPMQVNEVVVVGEENYDTGHVVEIKQQQTHPHPLPKGSGVYTDPTENSAVNTNYSPPSQGGAGGGSFAVHERKGGEQLSAYLAFVPMNVKELMQTRFETYFVNDSNYYIRFTYMTVESNSWQLRSTMEVEPNMKVFIEEFGREDLNGMERVAIQLVAYKREKPFLLKPAVDVQLRIDPVKFYKLHTFQDSDFFEQPALIYTIVENDKAARPLVVDAQQLKANLYRKSDEPKARPLVTPPRNPGDPVVVDLHASELLDNTNGLSPTDILNHQLDVFRKTLKQYEKQKGTKIIFIHGKGEGVLRKALVNELQYRYKSYTYQDASFREYGYGATQVTIK
ncbi:MAG: DUF2027 domain-containing protein [Prevotella sp.]|nr:DUF2027 domain-containing protein [Prevotella sp.]